jgi:hypothetical protein
MTAKECTVYGSEREVSSHVIQDLELKILTVHEWEVGSSHVVREFELGILTVGNPHRIGRRRDCHRQGRLYVSEDCKKSRSE